MIRIPGIKSYMSAAGGVCRNILMQEAAFPFYASFKLTSRCHFGCPFCNVKKNPVPDMSTEDVKKILDNLSKSSVLMISFEGGEPLLRSDIGELLDYARRRCNFYLLFTTSVKNLFDYPIAEYARNIDFLHISIDEGHDNLELFDLLPQITKLETQVSVQTVVTGSTIDSLDEKVRRCYETGANIVIIPAAHIDNTDNFFPDIDKLEQKVRALKKRFPYTIHTPLGYFNALEKGKCSSASVVIAPDGRLYYPCHIIGSKGPDLRKTDLTSWLVTKEARELRTNMKKCSRNCGWYQYYSIDSYTSIFSIIEAIGPMLFQKREKKSAISF
jgi:MoaA/NifB/PqqE/SkfB family radical SAM enzyme